MRKNLDKIAALIDDGSMSLGMASVNYRLTAEEKRLLKEKVMKLNEERKQIKQQILDEMRTSPELYHTERVAFMLGLDSGYDEDDSSLLEEVGISFDDIAVACELPKHLTAEILCEDDYPLPDYSVMQYDGDIVDEHRTDIFFLGAANVGKSSMVCSVIHRLTDEGCGEFDYGDDDDERSCEYRDAIIDCTKQFYKVPASSSKYSLLFCPVRISDTRKRLTIIDAGRRAMADLAKILEIRSNIQEDNNIYRVMSNDNSKMLFFLIDYGMIRQDNSVTICKLSLMIEKTIRALLTDGHGKNHTKGCTMSKVTTIGLVFTKCDLENKGMRTALQNVNNFIEKNLREVMRLLHDVCSRFDINKDNNKEPYVKCFSMGRFTVGNTLIYDPTCTDDIVNVIKETCPNQWPWHCKKKG